MRSAFILAELPPKRFRISLRSWGNETLYILNPTWAKDRRLSVEEKRNCRLAASVREASHKSGHSVKLQTPE
jgi:hypothetical protein